MHACVRNCHISNELEEEKEEEEEEEEEKGGIVDTHGR